MWEEVIKLVLVSYLVSLGILGVAAIGTVIWEELKKYLTEWPDEDE